LKIGRKINIIDNKKAGAVSITPNAGVGSMFGNTYSAVTEKDRYWVTDVNGDSFEYQGTTLSIGARLEYERKRWGIFVDTEVTRGQVKTGFLDGTADCTMYQIPTTIGLTFKISGKEVKNIFKKKSRK